VLEGDVAVEDLQLVTFLLSPLPRSSQLQYQFHSQLQCLLQLQVEEEEAAV